MNEEKYGYIYKTTIETSHGTVIYIGQKKSKVFIETYYGSGRKIWSYLKTHDTSKMTVELLEWSYGSQDDLNFLEAKYVAPHLGKDYCWNLVSGGHQPGITNELRLRMSHPKSETGKLNMKASRQAYFKNGGIIWNKNKTKIFSEETLDKMKSIKTGKICSDETKRKLSEKLKGRVVSEETKQKQRENHAHSQRGKSIYNNGNIEIFCFQEECPINFKKGRLPFSEETKQKQSLAKRGISTWNTGKTYTTNKKWYNNGEIEIKSESCPDGFTPGRSKFTKSKISNTLIGGQVNYVR